MTKGLPRSRGRGPSEGKAVQKIKLPFKNLAVTVNGATGNGWGTAVIGGLPEGNLAILAAAAYVQLSTASASVGATFNGNFSIGSGATADNTLSGTEVDMVASSALGAATAKVSPLARGASASASMVDNTDASKKINLNVLINDADISADGVAFLASGIVEVLVATLLDD
jgi:hypothetical protein